ncbi:mitochondrial import protein Pam17 [Lyophyllum atratum]|nr:mitochondrial import protein Pam17 [Lyophyllum atratum]
MRGSSLARPFTLSARSKNAVTEEAKTLTWPEYLAIRGGKRKWQTAITIPCALLGFFGGAAYFGGLETDPTKPIMGIDPFFFYGICTVGCVGVGALIGPSIGAALWRARHRNQVALVDAMDREFYRRIAKNRVDADLQSPTHPVPDYYGEKIGSLHQYRQASALILLYTTLTDPMLHVVAA